MKPKIGQFWGYASHTDRVRPLKKLIVLLANRIKLKWLPTRENIYSWNVSNIMRARQFTFIFRLRSVQTVDSSFKTTFRYMSVVKWPVRKEACSFPISRKKRILNGGEIFQACLADSLTD